MKRVRLTLFILTVLWILTAGLSVNAEERVVKFQSGAETGKVTLRIWDLQTLEGVVKVKAVDGGEIHLESVTVSTNDPGNTEICEAFENKVFMVSNGALIKTTITLDLSFVEDGEYLVTLSGGCTDKKGKYNAKGLYEEQSIIVGAPNTDDEEETKEEEKKEETVQEQPVGTGKTEPESRVTAADTTKKIEEKDESTTIVRKPQANSDSDEDDEALRELAKEAEKNAKKAKKSGSSLNLKNFWWIILLILLLLALPIIGYFLWKRKNAVEEEDYEGAASIDYDIEDDDMIEDNDDESETEE